MYAAKVTKTHFERCEPAGKELLRQAKEQYTQRKKSADGEIGAMAKDAAKHFVGLARGKVSVQIDPAAWERIFGKGRKNA
jgi:hypothetical protein